MRRAVQSRRPLHAPVPPRKRALRQPHKNLRPRRVKLRPRVNQRPPGKSSSPAGPLALRAARKAKKNPSGPLVLPALPLQSLRKFLAMAVRPRAMTPDATILAIRTAMIEAGAATVIAMTTARVETRADRAKAANVKEASVKSSATMIAAGEGADVIAIAIGIAISAATATMK